jgi:hypothetical protein
MIAALFVETQGVYSGRSDIDVWDKARDARGYNGPWPVVAHPPCQRWGRYWSGGPSAKVKRIKGDDGGCFAAALAAVRRWGGILEHPEASHAWRHFHLNMPPRGGGWVMADWEGGWTCCVEQGHYGHRARKATWLYAHSIELSMLRWGSCGTRARLDGGWHHGDAERYAGPRLKTDECAATPIEFRDLLISMALNSGREASRRARMRDEFARHGGADADVG